jgi:hypothetical protein
MSQWMSVSLGANAFPAVKEAIKHAVENPEHDPFIRCTLLLDPVEQRVTWQCWECSQKEGTAK